MVDSKELKDELKELTSAIEKLNEKMAKAQALTEQLGKDLNILEIKYKKEEENV